MNGVLKKLIRIHVFLLLFFGFKITHTSLWVGHYGEDYTFGTNLITQNFSDSRSITNILINENNLPIVLSAIGALPDIGLETLNVDDPSQPISNDSLKIDLQFKLIDIDPVTTPPPFNALWHMWAFKHNFIRWGQTINVLSGLFHQNALLPTGSSPIALNTLAEMQVNPHDNQFSPNNGQFALEGDTKVAFFWSTVSYKTGDVRTLSFIPTLLNTNNDLKNLLTGGPIKAVFPGSFNNEGRLLTYKNLITIFKIISGEITHNFNPNNLIQTTSTHFRELIELAVTENNQNLKNFYLRIQLTSLRLTPNDKANIKKACLFLQQAFPTEVDQLNPIVINTGAINPLAELPLIDVPRAADVPATSPVSHTSTTPVPSRPSVTTRGVTDAPETVSTPPSTRWTTGCASHYYEEPPADAACYVCLDDTDAADNKLINIAYNESQIPNNYIHENCLRELITQGTRSNANLTPLCAGTIEKYTPSTGVLSQTEREVIANLERTIATNIFVLNKLIILPTDPDALAFFNDYLNKEYAINPERVFNPEREDFFNYILEESEIAYNFLLRSDKPLDRLTTNLKNDITTLEESLTREPENATIYNNELRKKQKSLRELQAFKNWIEPRSRTPRTAISTQFDAIALDELIEKINQFDTTEYEEILKTACSKLPLGWRLENSPFHSQFLTVSRLSDPHARQNLINELTAIRASLGITDSTVGEDLRKQERFKLLLKEIVDAIRTENVETDFNEFLDTRTNTYTYQSETLNARQLYEALNESNKEEVKKYYQNNPIVTAQDTGKQELFKLLLKEIVDAITTANVETDFNKFLDTRINTYTYKSKRLNARQLYKALNESNKNEVRQYHENNPIVIKVAAEEPECPICFNEYNNDPLEGGIPNPKRRIELHPLATQETDKHPICAECLSKTPPTGYGGHYTCPVCRKNIEDSIFSTNHISKSRAELPIRSWDPIELGGAEETRESQRDNLISSRIKESLENHANFHLPPVGFDLTTIAPSDPNYLIYSKLNDISNDTLNHRFDKDYWRYRRELDNSDNFNDFSNDVVNIFRLYPSFTRDMLNVYIDKYWKDLTSYNFTDPTPEELQQMCQILYEQGKVPKNNYRELTWLEQEVVEHAIDIQKNKRYHNRNLLTEAQQEQLKSWQEEEKNKFNQIFFPGISIPSREQQEFIALMYKFLKLPPEIQQELRDFEASLGRRHRPETHEDHTDGSTAEIAVSDDITAGTATIEDIFMREIINNAMIDNDIDDILEYLAERQSEDSSLLSVNNAILQRQIASHRSSASAPVISSTPIVPSPTIDSTIRNQIEAFITLVNNCNFTTVEAMINFLKELQEEEGNQYDKINLNDSTIEGYLRNLLQETLHS